MIHFRGEYTETQKSGSHLDRVTQQSKCQGSVQGPGLFLCPPACFPATFLPRPPLSGPLKGYHSSTKCIFHFPTTLYTLSKRSHLRLHLSYDSQQPLQTVFSNPKTQKQLRTTIRAAVWVELEEPTPEGDSR